MSNLIFFFALPLHPLKLKYGRWEYSEISLFHLLRCIVFIAWITCSACYEKKLVCCITALIFCIKTFKRKNEIIMTVYCKALNLLLVNNYHDKRALWMQDLNADLLYHCMGVWEIPFQLSVVLMRAIRTKLLLLIMVDVESKY